LPRNGRWCLEGSWQLFGSNNVDVTYVIVVSHMEVT